MHVRWRGIVEGVVGATSSVLSGGLNETAGGWLTGGIAQSHLLPAAGHNSDQSLMAAASALYQQQPAAIQQVRQFIVHYLHRCWWAYSAYCF